MTPNNPMTANTLTPVQVHPACASSRRTETFSPARGEVLGGRFERAPRRRSVDHRYARFSPEAVRATRRLHLAAEVKCHRRPILLGLGVLLAVVSGCAVGPNYSRPTVASPTTWKETGAVVPRAVLPPNWWSLFNETDLDALETQAVAANQDLRRAVARVAEARSLARISEADLYPTLSVGGGHSINRASENTANAPRRDFEYEDHYRQLELSYEVDAWGRVRRSIEAGKAELAATETDMQVVLLTLTADVARNYFLLCSLDREKQVTESTVALRRETVGLQETRSKAGLINEVDVTRARTELANVEAELHSITRSRAQLEHALAVLCGKAPAEFALPVTTQDVVPPEIPAGLPSALLERRPDIVVAEEKLHAECARIGVAKAAFFPTIKLTGYAGGATADFGTLLDWSSRFGSLGPSIHVPIFEGGRNQANLNAAKARYEQSTAAYRATVLNAFREVEDSLSDLSTFAAQSEAVGRAVASARTTAALAGERYQQGLTSYLDVVDAQRAALQAERTQVQLQGQRAVSTILLAKALGGGWERGTSSIAQSP